MSHFLLTYTTSFSLISSIFGYVATITSRKSFIIIFSLLTATSTLLYVNLVPFFAYQWLQAVLGISINFNLAILFLYLRHQMDKTNFSTLTTSNSFSSLSSTTSSSSCCCSTESIHKVQQILNTLSEKAKEYSFWLVSFISRPLFERTKWTFLFLMATGFGWIILYSVLYWQKYSFINFRFNESDYFGTNTTSLNFTATPTTTKMMTTISFVQMALLTLIELVATISGLVGVLTSRFTLVGVYARLTLFSAVYVPFGTSCSLAWKVVSATLWLPAALVGMLFAAMLALLDNNNISFTSQPTSN